MEQGPTEQKILEQCYRSRRPLPKAIQEAPDLDLGLELYYSGFWNLNSCRQMGWGFGPIAWTDMADYARYVGLRGEEVQDFVYLIRSMDIEFLKFNAPKKEATEKGGKP